MQIELSEDEKELIALVNRIYINFLSTLVEVLNYPDICDDATLALWALLHLQFPEMERKYSSYALDEGGFFYHTWLEYGNVIIDFTSLQFHSCFDGYEFNKLNSDERVALITRNKIKYVVTPNDAEWAKYKD